MLKQRIKKIERNIRKIQGQSKVKLWLINVSSAKSEREKEKMVERKIKEITSGKVPYSDGNYFSEEDKNIFVINAVPRKKLKRQN